MSGRRSRRAGARRRRGLKDEVVLRGFIDFDPY
jgi:hypothetical protein